MNINSLFGNVASTPTTEVGTVNPSSNASTSSIPPAIGGATTTSISTPGQFLSEMQQLSQQNPTEFKAVAAQVATSFQNAASQTSGPQAQFLTQLANQFSQAAQTGSLQPTQGAESPSAGQVPQAAPVTQTGEGAGVHHHHHHHGGGHGAGGSATQSSDVLQALQTAMTILSQASTGTSTATASSPPSTST